MYYSKKDYKLTGYQKSKTSGKMYDALLKNTKTGRIVSVPFGDSKMGNYQDNTGLNLYPNLVHGDDRRRRNFRARHRGFLKEGFYSPGWFSYNILW